jgi:uncharacterized protein (DUF1501 family)
MSTPPIQASLTRRSALVRALGAGISIQLLGGRALAGTGGALANKRLVVIICRGGLDGLSLSPPVGDPDYARLRGQIAIAPFGQPGGALKLDETFGLHPSMAAVHALAMKGQARIAPAVATPDRERSHFEAQDVLESGGTVAYGTGSGWLNRAVQAVDPARRPRALSIGATAPLVLRGDIQAASWSPGGLASTDPRLPAILQDLYASDPLLGPALAGGLAAQSMAHVATSEVAAELDRTPTAGTMTWPADPASAPARKGGVDQGRRLGATLAGFLTQPDGPRVAAVEMDGFDTHAGQGAAMGPLAARLSGVDAFLDGLQAGLAQSDAWRDTVVVLATEFGRTARVNGTGGTDHGTASTVLVMGGALKPGGLIGDWPTLAETRLFENRDTTPTVDMRGLFKGVLRDHLGVERAKLDTLVFPGSSAVAPLGGIIA